MTGATDTEMRTPRRSKRLRWVTAVVTVVLVFITVLVWITRDEALRPHADLLPARLAAVPDAENAFWFLAQSDAQVVVPTTITLEDLASWARGNPITRQTLPTWKDVEACVQQNAATFASLEAGIDCAAYRSPEIETWAAPSLPSMLQYRRALVLLQLRSRWHLHNGRLDAALADAERGVRLGKHVVQTPECILEWMLGVMVVTESLDDLESLAAEDGVSAQRLRAVLAGTLAPAAVPINLARGLRSEFRVNLSSFGEGSLSLGEMVDGAGLESMPRGVVFKPNATLNQIAQFYRAAIAYVDAESSPGEFHSPRKPKGTVRRVLSGNALGETLLDVTMPMIGDLLKRQFRFRSRWARARLTLAARVYELEHGRAPARPEDMVPDILSELPVDPLTGEPPLYSGEAIGDSGEAIGE